MRIARATAAEAPSISALMHSLGHHFLAAPASPEAEAFLAATSPDRMALRIIEPSRTYAAAHDAQGLAGFVSLKGLSRVSEFFVRPDVQGQGVGRRLWNEVRLIAGAGDEIEFSVDSSLDATVVYRSFGFEVCGPVTQDRGIVFIPMRRPACTAARVPGASAH